MGRWATVAVTAPGCLLAVATTVALAMASCGRHPLWSQEPMSLSEAASVRDEGEVARLIEDGADYDVRYRVRAGLVFGTATWLTPLEAAIAADDPQIVRALVGYGPPLNAERWTYLRCIAGGNEVPPLLDSLRGSDVQPDCGRVQSPWPQDD